MNRKKGFTLVELLAVIAILAIILTILAPSLLNGVKGKKEDALNKIHDLIELAARNYVMDYDIDTPTIIQMEDLCKTNYIECPILNPETEEELNGYVFAGNDFFYGEDETIELTADFNVAEPNQTFNETYAPGTVIDLQDVSKESYEFLGWEVVEGNSFIKDNKLTIGTTSTLIKPKLVRYLNDYIKYLYNDESTRNTNGIIEDDTADKNIRYAGSDPNNYVYFNCKDKDDNNVKYGEDNYQYKNSCEIWRIIGVFDTKKSVSDIEGIPRIKIVRDAFSKRMSWDSSSNNGGTDNNSGNGINQWGDIKENGNTIYEGADLMRMLNGYYIGESNTCTYCYSANCLTSNDCTSIVGQISSISVEMVDNALWYTGSATVPVTALSAMYEAERGTQNGKTCSSGNTCNDNVERTTTWVGKIGLIYPSDYAYASTDVSCINDIYGRNSTCNANNWLHPSSDSYWTITPSAYSSYASGVFHVEYELHMDYSLAYVDRGVRPALYLGSNVQVIGGDGTSNLPYVLDM